jgi:anti-sigma regulatory factor (Ser/Thr protein kinase)
MSDAPTEPDLRLQMLSRPRLLAAARAMVSNVAQRLGFNEVECGQISLAVDEALCNVINHGYDRRPDGRIWLSVWALDEGRPGMRIVLEDEARQVDPATIQSRSLEDVRPGGLGVYIIREVMDEAVYECRDGGGMRLTMIKRQPRPGEPATDGAARQTGDA